MENKPQSHRADSIRDRGFVLSTPVSGSMRPMLRVRRDYVLFVKPGGRLRPLDVALYQREDGVHIVHRVLRVLPEGGYYFRGDNAWTGEYVPEDQILGVMQGFYRGDRYYAASHLGYRIYRRLWVWAHPLLILYKKGRRKLCSVFRSQT